MNINKCDVDDYIKSNYSIIHNYCNNINCTVNKNETKIQIDQKNNKCLCGNIFSNRCSNKLCKNCCNDNDCKKHVKFVKCINKLCKNCCNDSDCKKHEILIKKRKEELKKKDKTELCCFEPNDIETYDKLLIKIIRIKELRDIIMEFVDERYRCCICEIRTNNRDIYVKKCDVCGFCLCENCSVFTNTYNNTYFKCYMNDNYINSYRTGTYCDDCYDPDMHKNNDSDYSDYSDNSDDSDNSNEINDDYDNQENNTTEFKYLEILTNDSTNCDVLYKNDNEKFKYNNYEKFFQNNYFDNKEFNYFEIITSNTNCDLCNKNDNETFNCNKCEKLFCYECTEYQDEYEPCTDIDCTICDLQNEWYCKFIGRCCIECFPYEY